MKRTYKITVCKVCGLEAPFECEHMRAMQDGGENVFKSIEVIPSTENEEVTERLLQAQAELQTALGLLRLVNDPSMAFLAEHIDPKYIAMRMQACLSMVHSLMGDLGRPMFKPSPMPEGWTQA